MYQAAGEELNYQEIYEQAKEIQSYIDPTKYPSGLEDILKGKDHATELVRNLCDQLLKEIMNNEEVITQLRSEDPDAEKKDLDAQFQISKSTEQTCIEFLKDNDTDLDSWINHLENCEKLRKILKIFFTLCSQYNREEWCLFPTILDDDAFYAGAKQVFIKDAVKLSKYDAY